MPAKRIIPSMLLSKGRLVKGTSFKGHEDAGNPITTARIYNDQMADELSILDIDASPNKNNPDLETLYQLSKRCFIPISFGGGINSIEVAAQVIRAGADKVIVNQAGIDDMTFINSLSTIFGKQAVVFAIDFTSTLDGERVVTKSGTEVTSYCPKDLAKQAEKMGAGEIILTDVEHEGTRKGPNLNVIKEVSIGLKIPLVANGGVGDLDDFVNILSETNASAVSAGRILQFADNNLIKVRRYIQSKGIHLATH